MGGVDPCSVLFQDIHEVIIVFVHATLETIKKDCHPTQKLKVYGIGDDVINWTESGSQTEECNNRL